MSKKLERTAYHEAGHAVAAFHCDYALNTRLVSIEPKGDSAGRTEVYQKPSFDPETDFDAETRARIQDEIVVLYSGAEATRKFTGRYDRRGVAGDYGAANALASVSHVAPEVIAKYLDYCKAVARELVEAKWDDIEVVAKELLLKKSLSGKAVRELILDS